MTTGDRLIGRGVALTGIVFGAAYLVWRVTASLDGVPFWLSSVTLAVEVVGFVAVVATVWAIWRAPATPKATGSRRAVSDPSPASGPAADVDVLIRCSGQDPSALRATLLAARDLGALYVLDLGARPEIAGLALDAHAVYIATDPDDLDGLGQALPVLTAPQVLLLEAGDIPRPDAVAALAPWLERADVAVVQGPTVAAQPDSAEHDAGGRNDKEFERRALLPSLGSRGMAAFTGSGALLRRDAFAGLPIGHATRPMVQAEITVALWRNGWRIVAPGGDPVVAVAAMMQPDVVESMHACEASGALHLLTGVNGALRINPLSWRQRLALIALASRPLAGVRRSVIIGVLLASLLAGSLPLRPSTLGLVGLWMPWFVLGSAGLWVLSGGSLRPGDRLRSSMRLLGASWRGLLAPNGRPEDPQYAVAGAFGVHHGVASAVAVGAISMVVGLRGISDRLTHTLGPLPGDETAGLLAVALWSLGGGLDALRLLARRAQTRRGTRVASSLPSTFADRSALVVDLTPDGAAVISDARLPAGARDQLELVIPTVTGCVSATVPITVRNVRADFSGDWRSGVQFDDVSPYVAEALAEYCLVQPGLELLGVPGACDGSTATARVVMPDERALLPRRAGLRVAALVAVAGALASAIPTSAAASAGGSTRLTGRIVVSGPGGATGVRPGGPAGAVVTVVCAVDDGADGVWGTVDDVYGAPISTVARGDGTYALTATGDACWVSVAPPVGFMLRGDGSTSEALPTAQVLDLRAPSIDPVEIVPTADQPGSPHRPGEEGATALTGVVWADLDADDDVGDREPPLQGVTVTLFGPDGSVRGSETTSAGGRWSFTDVAAGRYRVGVSNLPNGLVATGVLGMTAPVAAAPGELVDVPIGLRPPAPRRNRTPAQPGGDARRLLPRPDPGELAAAPGDRSPAVALMVVVLATLIGLSVVAGSVRPGRELSTRRLPTSR